MVAVLGIAPRFLDYEPSVLLLNDTAMIAMEQVRGFEPLLSVWKTDVLTVEHYTCMAPRRGVEPLLQD